MEWYIATILLLSAAFVGALVFIVNLVSIIDDLRMENNKLKIDLLHK